MTQPMSAGHACTNVYGEEMFKVRVTFGSAAVASYLSKDVTFARTGVGTFTVTFPQTYKEITDFSFGMKDATGAVLNWVITDESTLLTTGVITLKSAVAAGTATEPASGDKVYLSFGVSRDNQNANYGG